MTATPEHGRLTGCVLVADDDPRNRMLLVDLLEARGHRVFEAADGEEALAIARAQRPDVILLDVMMPRLDGYEVCRRLKTDPSTAATPVLLVTSLDARDERLAGMRAGANDFITKPLDSADLVLRVRNALHMHRLFTRLEGQLEQLRHLEGARDTLVHLLVHDLRSPLTGLHGYLELIADKARARNDAEDLDYLAEAKSIVTGLREMVTTVLDVSRLEAGRMPLERSLMNAADVVHEALRMLGPAPGPAILRWEPPAAPLHLLGDRDLLRRVVHNLVANAFRFTPDGGEVRVRLERGDSTAAIVVEDTGVGIAAARLGTIFEKFAQGELGPQRQGSGLGLTFCKLAVDAHGGTIDVRSVVGTGSTFTVILPLPRGDGSA